MRRRLSRWLTTALAALALLRRPDPPPHRPPPPSIPDPPPAPASDVQNGAAVIPPAPLPVEPPPDPDRLTVVPDLPPAYCDACGVARARYRFARFTGEAGDRLPVLDMCGHHAHRHRAALAAQGWTEFDLIDMSERS